MQKQINEFSEMELKAMVYDNLFQIEQCQANIKVLNQELQKRATPLGEVTGTKETKKEDITGTDKKKNG